MTQSRNTSQRPELQSPAGGHLATFSDLELPHLKSNPNGHYGSSPSLWTLLSAGPCAQGLTCVLSLKEACRVGAMITPLYR